MSNNFGAEGSSEVHRDSQSLNHEDVVVMNEYKKLQDWMSKNLRASDVLKESIKRAKGYEKGDVVFKYKVLEGVTVSAQDILEKLQSDSKSLLVQLNKRLKKERLEVITSIGDQEVNFTVKIK